MLVVKPNLRRMRYMRDSGSEGGTAPHGALQRLRWERIIVAAVIIGAIVAGLIVLLPR